MPDPAPVTSATLFSKDKFMSFSEPRRLIHYFRCERSATALADRANLLAKHAIIERDEKLDKSTPAMWRATSNQEGLLG